MSQNTRLLLIALVVMVVFGIFLQSLIARSLQDSFGTDALRDLPTNPTSFKPSHGIEAVPGAAPPPPKVDKKDKGK
jgi:hypothetical protein